MNAAFSRSEVRPYVNVFLAPLLHALIGGEMLVIGIDRRGVWLLGETYKKSLYYAKYSPSPYWIRVLMHIIKTI